MPTTKHITVTPAVGTWVVRAGGAVLGESSRALELTEGDLPPVIYFPREDIGMAFLDATDHSTTCPHKGTASYFSIMSKSKTYTNAVWSYETPNAEVSEIAGYLAFMVQDGVAVEQV
ncbi:DUF427 domain-containing protein [Sagittula sp. S175]|uniref:DUF427 domain-containing protein n=1 Tax=Sagittula sp. S175 TaxID=3415129 RepID=UPI003C7ED7FA